MYNDPFLNPSAAFANIDRLIVRQSILKTLLSFHRYLYGCCLDVGCGEMPYRMLLLQPPFKVTNYLGLDRAGDRHQMAKPDILFTNGAIPLASRTVDSALCTEVLEHCQNPSDLLEEIHRVLKPGASLILTVPFLWPLHEVPNDYCRYTPFALRQLLISAGFVVQELRPLGGWDKSLAQMLGLYARRRPMNRFLRFCLTLLIYPIWHFLRHFPEKTSDHFSESAMITGLAIRAERF